MGKQGRTISACDVSKFSKTTQDLQNHNILKYFNNPNYKWTQFFILCMYIILKTLDDKPRLQCHLLPRLDCTKDRLTKMRRWGLLNYKYGLSINAKAKCPLPFSQNYIYNIIVLCQYVVRIQLSILGHFSYLGTIDVVIEHVDQ